MANRSEEAGEIQKKYQERKSVWSQLWIRYYAARYDARSLESILGSRIGSLIILEFVGTKAWLGQFNTGLDSSTLA